MENVMEIKHGGEVFFIYLECSSLFAKKKEKPTAASLRGPLALHVITFFSVCCSD